MTAYADIRELNRLIGTRGAVSGAYVSVDPTLEGAFQAFVRRTPELAGVTLRRLVLASFNAVVAGHIMEIARILMLASCVIAIGVLYSSAQMSFAEKQRELATLRVLGFTRQETTTVLLGELAAQLIISLPVGCLLGRGVASLLSLAMSSDLYRLPVVVLPSTYLFTVAVVIVAGLAVGLLLRRSIDRLVFAEALCTRE
jgi:putative ABC transport system permease protein